ncbi:MAG: hypothetical protein ACFFC7_14540 [Candidatus Hermodarchaeota archaeon]
MTSDFSAGYKGLECAKRDIPPIGSDWSIITRISTGLTVLGSQKLDSTQSKIRG